MLTTRRSKGSTWGMVFIAFSARVSLSDAASSITSLSNACASFLSAMSHSVWRVNARRLSRS